MPLEINGLCDPKHLPKAAPEQGKVQTTLDPFRRPGLPRNLTNIVSLSQINKGRVRGKMGANGVPKTSS
eukprot:4446202-Amphidinium_carterae.1